MPNLTLIQPLKRENLREVVHARLCDLILKGGIEPGQSVTVASLSSALQVSPMPIREAMSRLVDAGALTRLSGRSMGVPKLTRAELDDLTRVRREIEGRAVSWAVAHQDPALLATLDAIFARMTVAEKAADNPAFINLNYQLHFAIYERSGSDLLLGIIRNLWLRITPYFHMLDAEGHLKVSNDIHARLLASIRARDAEAATACLHEDIDRAYAKLAGFLFASRDQHGTAP